MLLGSLLIPLLAKWPSKKDEGGYEDQRRDDPPVRYLGFPSPFCRYGLCRCGSGCDQRQEHDRDRHVSAVRATKYSFRGEVKPDERSRRYGGKNQMPDDHFPGHDCIPVREIIYIRLPLCLVPYVVSAIMP